jgi:hypothetical protein
LAAELVLGFGKPKWSGLDAAEIDALRQSLKKKMDEDPDFWSAVGLMELKIYEALADRKLATALPGILADLRRMRDRVVAPRMWDSVCDQGGFILPPYIRVAAAAERKAAEELLAKLKEYAENKDDMET